ncbi:MAG: hypothetical protein JO294_03735 [Alphaproteobacteria bacterium]|nr:hypothetical protein [Alphaproteobacteria bacterium]
MIPLLYLMFLIGQLGTKVLNTYHPAIRGGAQTVAEGVPVSTIVVYSLLGMLIVGFIASLLPRKPA